MTGLDHLVVMAHTLAQGVAWCEAALGVTPGPGGEHPLMGTHNRLINISSSKYSSAYLEIIAINSEAPDPYPARYKRWFDMDNSMLARRVEQHGPQLIHWVAGVSNIDLATQSLAELSIDRGSVLPASRLTPQGLLQWKISVRDDGQRLFDGCLPTLIEWGDRHPTDNMPHSGVTLQSLNLAHPDARILQAGLHSIGLAPFPVHLAPARIAVTLQTPRGFVDIHSS